MPVIFPSSYETPKWFTNPHVQTIYPSLFRRVEGVSYTRKRIDTPDGDFLDLDFSCRGSEKAAVVLHGLEGDSGRAYVRGMVRAFNRAGWDAVAMNFRGCSGASNKRQRFYHSGDTADLSHVLAHLRTGYTFKELALIGFSLGGNVVLKYLGEMGSDATDWIRGAAVFSVPCDLTSGAQRISGPSNRFYMRRFLRMLHEKIRAKMKIMPGEIDDHGYETIKTFKDFDDRYTAPLHGFANAENYWTRASGKPFIPQIKVPTLLVNAMDDPFLGLECFPLVEAADNPSFFLETPRHGGHVGFVSFTPNGDYWSEQRAVAFMESAEPCAR